MAKLDLYLNDLGEEVKQDESCVLDKDEQLHTAYFIKTEKFP